MLSYFWPLDSVTQVSVGQLLCTCDTMEFFTNDLFGMYSAPHEECKIYGRA